MAFGANSLLCRLALKQTGIDAASFTLIRILSGALMLCLFLSVRSLQGRTTSSVAASDDRQPPRPHGAFFPLGGNWLSALTLFAYAASFSFAYARLSAATGALLLFAAVQATMILWGLRRGERLHARQLFGLTLAFAGLVALVFPGLSAPPLSGSIIMLCSGVTWGTYSLRGQGEGDAAASTTGNFLRAVPFAALLSLALLPSAHLHRAGTTYAVFSGAITSGLGYIIWYTALPHLKATSAAIVQLSVPVLAATGGILLLHESLSLRFLFASVAVLGGIALVVIRPFRRPADSVPVTLP